MAEDLAGPLHLPAAAAALARAVVQPSSFPKPVAHRLTINNVNATPAEEVAWDAADERCEPGCLTHIYCLLPRLPFIPCIPYAFHEVSK